MPKAIWNRIVIAEAPENAVEIVEGNVYFPLHAVRQEYLRPSEQLTQCHWKGTANYFHVVVGLVMNRNAAWIYRQPFDAAKKIANHIAFWHGVKIEW